MTPATTVAMVPTSTEVGTLTLRLDGVMTLAYFFFRDTWHDRDLVPPCTFFYTAHAQNDPYLAGVMVTPI